MLLSSLFLLPKGLYQQIQNGTYFQKEKIL